LHRVEEEFTMPWIVANMKWIMVLCGLLTSTMIYAAISPAKALESTFGQSLSGPLAELIIRNWAVLIAMGGGMLVYAAFRPLVRPLVLVFTGIGKAFFVALVLRHGGQYLQHQAGIAVVTDSLMVILFAWYLLASSSLTLKNAR
jgi:nucleoside recognition membrane protein YjiH